LRYLADDDSKKDDFELEVWMIVLICCLCCCCIAIGIMWKMRMFCFGNKNADQVHMYQDRGEPPHKGNYEMQTQNS